MKFSFSTVLVILFAGFIVHSIKNIIGIFSVPGCAKGDKCYRSFLNSQPSLDLVLYVSDNSRSGNFKLILSLDQFDYTKPFEKEISVELSRTVRKNGTLFIHTVLVPSNPKKELLTIRELVDLPDATYLKHHLTKYAMPASASFNLLKEESKQRSVQPVTHIQSKFAVIMCADAFEISYSNIPPELHSLRVNRNGNFLPLLKQDIMQMRLRDLQEVTPEAKTASFSFMYSPVSVGKIRFFTQIEATLSQFTVLGFTERDLDEVKGVFADTNLYLLCGTILIASVHLLLDFLSFKNDVNFWKTQTSMAGLSTSSVFWRAFSQTAIFAYLVDEGTSLLVLIPSGIGTLIEFWKVSKVLKRRFAWMGGLDFKKEGTESAAEIQTRKFDKECMKYMCYLLYPLCICVAVYSLYYQSHKSWYSWIISSIVNGVYAFGFLFMFPQLFINYRLKSVAALPWRAFTYRAFSTFIDDIFAFIITMPTAHRLACFRDDIVFIIYLYQRWLYPVDKSRTDDVSEPVVEEEPKKDK